MRINSINIFLIDNRKIIGLLGKERSLLKSIEEFKIKEVRKIWKRLIELVWIRTNLFDKLKNTYLN